MDKSCLMCVNDRECIMHRNNTENSSTLKTLAAICKYYQDD